MKSIESKPPLSKRLRRAVAESGMFSAFVSMLERLGDNRPNLLRTLTYHRIDELDAEPALDPAIISATPDVFDRQMALLAERYRVVSLPELLDVVRTGRTLPPRSVLVTFDDAYADFASNAWPILQRHGIPATLFVPTAYPGQPMRPFWWDRLHRVIVHTRQPQLTWLDGHVLSLGTPAQRGAAERLLRNRLKQLPHAEALEAIEGVCRQLGDVEAANGVLSWDALRRLAKEGLTLGAHTQTHPLLDRVPLDVAREEAVGSLNDLRRELGEAPPVLAYPAGGCTAELARTLEEAGFELAFTTRRGVHDLRTGDRLRIRRINVGFRSTQAAFRAQLLPAMRYLHPWLN